MAGKIRNHMSPAFHSNGSCATMLRADKARGEREEDMRLPASVWADPSYAEVPLTELKSEWVEHLLGRARPTSPATIRKYEASLNGFIRFVIAKDQPATLGMLTPTNVDAWVRSQRDAAKSEDGIASRLSALKVFSNRFVFRHLEATTTDLLAKVGRVVPPETPVSALTEEEQETLLDIYNRYTYEDVRNKAFVAVLLATGLRIGEALGMDMADFNPMTGEFTVVGKGNKWRPVKLSDRVLKMVRAYLRIRPQSAHTNVWVSEDGKPLSFWGAQSVFRRLKVRSGLRHVHAHMLRHNFAKKALENGVERAILQDMLGHATPAMTNRYLGDTRKTQAARAMPAFSPI